MISQRANVDLSEISWETERGKDRVSYYRSMLKKIDEDKEKERRLEQSECFLCFYEKSRIGGSACTQVQCAFCNKVLSSGTTNIDKMCVDCAKKAGLCKHCGADVNLKNRRKRELPAKTETMEIGGY